MEAYDRAWKYRQFIKVAKVESKAYCKLLAPLRAEYKENKDLVSRVYEMALQAASSGNNWDVLAWLVKSRLNLVDSIQYDSTDVTTLNQYVSSALDFAVRNGNMNLFNWLFNNPHYADLCRRLMLSDQGLLCVVARVLGQTGQSLYTTIDPAFIKNVGTKPFLIGLTEALRHGHRDMAKAIVSELDSNIALEHSSMVRVLMLFCAYKDLPDLLQLLYEKSPAAKQQNWWAKEILSPLYLAAKAGSPKCTGLALRYWGSDVATLNEVYFIERFTALHVAAYYGHEDVVSLLLHLENIDLQVKDVLARTPLHYACLRGHISVVSQLLQRQHMDGNSRDINGMTPLQLAICGGHTDVVEEWLSIRGGCFSDHTSREAKECTFQKFDPLFNFQQLSVHLSLPQIMDPEYGNQLTIGELYEPPNLIDSVFWSPGQFTSLHFAAALPHHELYRILQKFCRVNELEHVEFLEDSLGFTADDWARVQANARDLSNKNLRYVGAETSYSIPDNSVLKQEETKQAEIRYLLKESDQFTLWKKILNLGFDICQSLREHDMDKAKRLLYQAKNFDANLIRFGHLISEALILHIFPRLETLENLHVDYCLSKKCMEDGTTRKDIEGLMIDLCHAREFTTDMLERWFQQAVVFGFDDLAYHLMVTHKVNCNTALDISYLMMKNAVNLPSNGKLSPFKLAVMLKRQKMETWMAYRDDVKRGLYEERQVYVDYANTILVGAVLIAGVAYQGWLEPPSGFDQEGYAWVYRHSFYMQLFWWLNNISFFLAVATVIAAGLGAMPSTSNEQLVDAVSRVHSAASVASILFPMSMICIMVAFAAASFTIVPHHLHTYPFITKVTATCGTFLCSLFILWFIKRLLDLNSNYKSARTISIYLDKFMKNFMSNFLDKLVGKLAKSKKLQIFVRTGSLLMGFYATAILLCCIAWPSLFVIGPLLLLLKLKKLCESSYLMKLVKKLGDCKIFQRIVKMGTLLVGFCASTIFLCCTILPFWLLYVPVFLIQLLARLSACSYLDGGIESALDTSNNCIEKIHNIFDELLYMRDFRNFIRLHCNNCL